MIRYYIDINSDLGEGIGNDAEIMPYISSCNIACGGHAGSKETIENTVKLALENNVKIGAHPSYPDKENFGRKKMIIPLIELQVSIEDQINLIKKVVEKSGKVLHHIKPHGALYNEAANNPTVARAILEAIKKTAKNAFLYVPFGSVIQNMAIKEGIKIQIEAFADRNYNLDLSLVSRKESKAIIDQPKIVLRHLVNMVAHKKVKTIDGAEVAIMAETFCVHGDNKEAIKILKFLHKELPKNNIRIE